MPHLILLNFVRSCLTMKWNWIRLRGERKIALFLIMYDTDTTFNFVIAMLQSQLFHLLCDKADDEYGGRLPVHGETVMTAEYRPVEYGKDYDVVDNPDKFQLYIDGKEIK